MTNEELQRRAEIIQELIHLKRELSLIEKEKEVVYVPYPIYVPNPTYVPTYPFTYPYPTVTYIS